MRDAGKDFRGICFFALRGEGTLAWAATVQLAAQERGVERHAGRAPVDDHAEGGAMAFAEGGDAETVSVDIAHLEKC